MGLTGPQIAQHFTGWVNAIRRRPRIAGYVFTQLTDVEWEANGLLTYQRDLKEHGLQGVDGILAVNGTDAVVLGGNPGQDLSEGEPLEVEISLARGGDGQPLIPQGFTLGWVHLALDAEGGVDGATALAEGTLELEAGWGLTSAGTITLTGPGQDSLLLVLATLDGELVAVGSRSWGTS